MLTLSAEVLIYTFRTLSLIIHPNSFQEGMLSGHTLDQWRSKTAFGPKCNPIPKRLQRGYFSAKSCGRPTASGLHLKVNNEVARNQLFRHVFKAS